MATARGRSTPTRGRRAPTAGDPTSPEDPIIRQIRRGLTEFRGAYYQDEGWAQQVDGRKVAVFSIQGWTDDLFPAVESFRMFKYLKRLDPRWPVEVALGGRRPLPRAEQARHLAAPQRPGLPMAPVEHQREPRAAHDRVERGDRLRRRAAALRGRSARRPRGSRTARSRSTIPAGTTVSPLGVADPERPRHRRDRGPAVQPGEPCRQSDGPIPPGAGYTEYSRPLESTRTYVGIGTVTRSVHLGRRGRARSSTPAYSTSRRTAPSF